jgi:enoyl-CoA hydratase/carnithine racemase
MAVIDTGTTDLLAALDEGVLTLTLNRPEARNAMSGAVAFRHMKENLNRAMAGDVDDCLDLEATHHVHCGQTADHREAAKAFVEKRAPVFTGR